MEALDWRITPLMLSAVEAAERLGGGGRESELAREAASRGETGRYGDAAHFAKGLRALRDRGIFRTERLGRAQMWYLTDQAWAERGHHGPPPRLSQEAMF
jgi:hypothetical protein